MTDHALTDETCKKIKLHIASQYGMYSDDEINTDFIHLENDCIRRGYDLAIERVKQIADRKFANMQKYHPNVGYCDHMTIRMIDLEDYFQSTLREALRPRQQENTDDL